MGRQRLNGCCLCSPSTLAARDTSTCWGSLMDEREEFQPPARQSNTRIPDDVEIETGHHCAHKRLLKGVEYLPIDQIAGRIATTPFVVYPPGIATIVPGERLTARAQPMIDYLRMFEASFNTFPGFEVEIQGVYRETDASGKVRLHTYVVRE